MPHARVHAKTPSLQAPTHTHDTEDAGEGSEGWATPVRLDVVIAATASVSVASSSSASASASLASTMVPGVIVRFRGPL
jgi:hypothetical protein